MSTVDTPNPPSGLRAGDQAGSPDDLLRGYARRLSSGDIGSLPIIVGLIIIAIIFQSRNSNFLTSHNFVNLITQMAGVTIIAFGVVFVLLLGEIDLSIGYVSAVSGVAVAILLRPPTPAQAVLGWLVPYILIMVVTDVIWMVLNSRRKRRGLKPDWLIRPRLIFLFLDIAVIAVAYSLSKVGWQWYTAIPVVLLAVAGIGLLQGLIITLFHVPSFIVTLAGLLAWNGVVLHEIGQGGTVIIQDKLVNGIANSFIPPDGILSWVIAAVLIAAYALMQFLQYTSRKRKGLRTRPVAQVVIEVVVLAVAAAIFVAVCNQDPRSGVPVVGLIMLVGLVALTYLARSTPFGRYVYAVGGNAEAARRAGINVTRIRIIVFMMSSALAGFGGIVLASRLRSVDTNAGGGNLLLDAIASAVIGGTSLFGGRGFVASAVLGALIIASVDNGLGLLSLSSGDKFIVTGIVLLIAVIVDALSRRRQQQAGIA